ncbi:MAG: hypothetical protein K0R54_3319 [Clostridiaceae bacterium]|jgi:hypothetical protein|nr:hypothetical protein [Clostridiaceae bacterium]
MDIDSYNRLLNKIRENEVVLWVGAGFSKAAGFPIGSETVEKIKEQCSDTERKQLEKFNMLPDFTEKFVKLRASKRIDLIKILEDIFSITVNQEMLKYHKKLNNIPQIDIIITTNYDKLIEMAYGDGNITVIRSDKDIVRIRSNKKKLYKIHSDFDNIEDLVITRSDYTRFFGERMDSIMWNHIKSIISQKTILFVGYALGDQNVDFIFDDLVEKLGDLARESFVVAPNLESYESDDLIRRGITYLNSTGEEFIDKLEKDIKNNLVKDCQHGRVDFKNVRRILKEDGINANFRIKNDVIQLHSISEGKKKVKGNMKVTFQCNDDADKFKETMKSLNNLFIGKSFDSVTVPAEFIKKINNSFNGVKLLPFDEQDIEYGKMIYKPNPQEKEIWDLYINDDECINLEVEIYKSEYLLQIKSECKYFKLTIKNSLEKESDDTFNINSTTYTVNLLPQKSLIENNKIFKLLEEWINGKPILLYKKDNYEEKLEVPYEPEVFEGVNFNSFVEKWRYIFSSLILIQKHFKVQFENFDEITREDMNSIILLRNYCDNNCSLKFIEFPVRVDDLKKMDLSEEGSTIEISLDKDSQVISLLKKHIDIGNGTLRCEDAYIGGYDEDKTIAFIRSKSNSINIEFEKYNK